MYESQKKEIETIKDRTLILKLSDADCDRILQKAAGCGLTVSELLASFIGDLIDGTYTNGSDERMLAQDWFDRCGFRQMADRTLLRFLLECGEDIENFLYPHALCGEQRELCRRPQAPAEQGRAAGHERLFRPALREIRAAYYRKGKDL